MSVAKKTVIIGAASDRTILNASGGR